MGNGTSVTHESGDARKLSNVTVGETLIALAPGETAQIIGPTLCLTTRRVLAWDKEAKQVVQRPINQLAIVRRVAQFMRRDLPIVEVVLADGRVFSAEVQPNAALDYIAEQLLNSPQRLETLGTIPQAASSAQWQHKVEPVSPLSAWFLFLLFGWIPILGPFACGFVAGRKANGVAGGVMIAVLPAVILGDLALVGILYLGHDASYVVDSLGVVVLYSILSAASVVVGANVGGSKRS